MADVKVVAPANMGKGIKWNPDTKQYEVSLGNGLYFDENGIIQKCSYWCSRVLFTRRK